ncbi:HAD-IA family hydrolase [candidate division GN15 bacterium]|nr:HAD-IA family hydrolase [candidate division GN15 bacterium]
MSDRCVIFDLDGTLIDSSDGVVEATNYALAAFGLPTRTAGEIKPYIGYPLERMFADFTDNEYEPLRLKFQEKAEETVAASTRPLPYVDDILGALRADHYRLAIATTKIRVHIDKILAKCNWTDFFEATVGGDEVASVKPAPDAFELALERLGADPAATIVVGDTINDVIGAQAAGLPVVAVRSPFGHDGELDSSGATYLIDSMADLPGVIRAHFHREDIE